MLCSGVLKFTVSLVICQILPSFFSDVVSANQKCHGSPRMYNGKRCASTSNFHDGHKGACGCGPARGDSQFDWNKSGYVAAASQHLFDRNGGTWCGEACGRCVKLTTTGKLA